jgi:nicotinamide mononucleotide adenylyltransferase
MKKVAFFPGKFQPPHIGHVLTISKLLKKYHVIIGISEDGPRVSSQEQVKHIFKTIFDNKTEYFIFKGVLTDYDNIKCFPTFDVLLTGNDDVIKWAKKLNLPTKKIPRSECIGGSGTELRRLHENR